MNFHKEYLKLSERVIKINRHLAALELPVMLCMGFHGKAKPEFYIFLTNFIKDKHNFNIRESMSKTEIIEAARKLAKPQFRSITKACINAIGEQFWLDKETLVTVEAITREGILLVDNSLVDQSRLFIKE
jgi:hypothetical protein